MTFGLHCFEQRFLPLPDWVFLLEDFSEDGDGGADCWVLCVDWEGRSSEPVHLGPDPAVEVHVEVCSLFLDSCPVHLGVGVECSVSL